ncbi:MAG: glycosyltransferase [Acidimicrobiales bacterium]
MRVLYLTVHYPYPLNNGGNIRQFNFIKELARSHTITLLSLSGPIFPADATALAALAPFTEDAIGFEVDPRPVSVWRKAIRRLRWHLATEAVEEAVQRLAVGARDLQAQQPFDAVVVSGLSLLPALDALPSLPAVIDVCDSLSALIRTKARLSRRAAGIVYLLDYLRVRQTERQACARGTRLLFAARRDREAVMRPRDSGRGVVLPTGVDTDHWTRTTSDLGHKTVVFTGALDYKPNGDAALHLLQDIMPLVWRDEPDTRLLLVGKNPEPVLVAAAAHPRVQLTGEVPQVRPFVEQGSVFAAPVRFGAGIQTKLLEAMSMELPAVASPLAAGGLVAEDGQLPPLTVATTTEEFAARLVERLREVDAGGQPHREGRRYVVDNFGWPSVGKRLDRALRDAVDVATID